MTADECKEYVQNKLSLGKFDCGMLVKASEVQDAISTLKLNKAAGPDNLKSKCFKYSHVKLSILLSCCFTSMLCHGFIPPSMMATYLVPLFKNQCGKLSDIKNYRQIALCNISSKLFERTEQM